MIKVLDFKQSLIHLVQVFSIVSVLSFYILLMVCHHSISKATKADVSHFTYITFCFLRKSNFSFPALFIRRTFQFLFLSVNIFILCFMKQTILNMLYI